MARGPTKYPTRGVCIYCRKNDVRLTDEHIVPYSLGGQHVLEAASCHSCANVTMKFEQKVARDLWGDARASYNAPTRRKRERKTHVVYQDPTEPWKTISVPVGEYPGTFVFYTMDQAGLLQGLPEFADSSAFWNFIAISDNHRLDDYHSKHPGKVGIMFRHVPMDFGRMLAKIGYCQALTSLDLSDFRPICLPYILGQRANVSYVVGGTKLVQTPEPSNGYSLSTIAFGDQERLMIVVLIRLYANTSSPAYHVVVGDARSPEQIEQVRRKLAGQPEISLPVSELGIRAENHWMPRVWPLPL